MGGYDLVHYDDLAYVASAHQERKLQKENSELSLCIDFIHFSFKNWSIRNDCLQAPNQRRAMAVAADQFTASV